MHAQIQGTFTLIVFVLLSIGCSMSKTNSVTQDGNKQMELTITKIQDEKDGQTLFLEDNEGKQYITIISPANGNWLELNIDDRVSLISEEIMKSKPPQIISKDIKILESVGSFRIEYEKTEEEIYWIHSRKKNVLGIGEQPVECFQYQADTTLNIDGEWDLLCDKIQYFTFLEGKFYQIKVRKKWLKNHKTLMDRAPYDLELIAVLSRKTDETYVNPIKTRIFTNKSTFALNEAINLSMTIQNTGEKPYTFLPWGTPLENVLTSDCLEVKHNGIPIPYIGIMVKRIPPTEKDYITIKTDETSTGIVNLLDGYTFDAKGVYTIQFKESYQGLPASNIQEIEVR